MTEMMLVVKRITRPASNFLSDPLKREIKQNLSITEGKTIPAVPNKLKIFASFVEIQTLQLSAISLASDFLLQKAFQQTKKIANYIALRD